MDLVRELRALTFASRLKRLSDKLKSDATRIYQAAGVPFHDSWFLVAIALSRQDGVSVTEMAELLGISHGAVSQMTGAMQRRGLVALSADDGDGRKTLLSLTKAGRRTVAALQPIWNSIGDATEELIDATGQDLLLAITQLEDQLTERSLAERVGGAARRRSR